MDWIVRVLEALPLVKPLLGFLRKQLKSAPNKAKAIKSETHIDLGEGMGSYHEKFSSANDGQYQRPIYTASPGKREIRHTQNSGDVETRSG